MAKKEALQKTEQQEHKLRYPNRKVERYKVDGYANFYSNNTEVTASPWDIRMRFGQLVDANEELLSVEEYATVFMSPEHAKAFAQVLQAHVDKYEATFGPIKNPGELTTTPWADKD